MAPTGSTVLLLGETGTGKERIRRRHSRAQPAPVPPHGEGELRRHPGDAHRVGALRPGEGRVHRRPDLAGRAIRAGQRRRPSSSTRSATCPSKPRPSCCASSRTASSSGSALPGPSTWTCASSRPRTRTSTRPFATGVFERTCSSG
ncbi:MAG: hypothetical protein MZV64_05060 [Ignavibacteriales bacterium]|nr:hypothetical protein [Ignavibacteriales bacterium]